MITPNPKVRKSSAVAKATRASMVLEGLIGAARGGPGVNVGRDRAGILRFGVMGLKINTAKPPTRDLRYNYKQQKAAPATHDRGVVGCPPRVHQYDFPRFIL